MQVGCGVVELGAEVDPECDEVLGVLVAQGESGGGAGPGCGAGATDPEWAQRQMRPGGGRGHHLPPLARHVWAGVSQPTRPTWGSATVGAFHAGRFGGGAAVVGSVGTVAWRSGQVRQRRPQEHWGRGPRQIRRCRGASGMGRWLWGHRNAWGNQLRIDRDMTRPFLNPL